MNGSQFDLKPIMDSIVNLISTWGLRALGAVALLLVGFMAAKIVRRSVRRALERSALDPTLVPFLSNLTYYALLTFLIVAVLSLFGIQTTSFIAVLGAAGLAVGLALQGTLSHFASGVMLLIFRPLQVGDYVDVGGTAGSVVEIGIFTTTLNTPDNVRVVVPNGSIFGQVIKNYAANETRRNDMVVGISYGDDIPKAVATIKRVLSEDSRVLSEPAAVVAVSELGDSSVNLVVRPWCKQEDYWGLRFDLMQRMKEQLEADGCSIPFPQRDVHLFQEKSPSAA